MSGIYIHIPFCSKKCNYCDFYSIVPLLRKQDFLECLVKEIELRNTYFGDESISTLYFGGGTPSLLDITEVSNILEAVNKNFKLKSDCEITFEANPENLNVDYLKGLKEIGVNRLSIGIQSFQEDDLVFLKRTHNAKQAEEAVLNAHNIGFDNISTDLIYGLPLLTTKKWEENLKRMFDLPISHLSSYHLTYEEGTLLYKKLKQGVFKPRTEQESLEHFELLMKYVKLNDFEAYEISNFAKNGLYSKHNRSYWQQKKYLGLGPSAHSYDLNTRQWNVRNLQKYIEGFKKNSISISEKETLTEIDKLNDLLITSLRTKWGVDLSLLKKSFGKDINAKLKESAKPFIDDGSLVMQNNHLILSQKGILISDYIMEKMFVLNV